MRQKDTERVVRTVGMGTRRGPLERTCGMEGASRDSEMKRQKGTNVKDK